MEIHSNPPIVYYGFENHYFSVYLLKFFFSSARQQAFSYGQCYYIKIIICFKTKSSPWLKVDIPYCAILLLNTECPLWVCGVFFSGSGQSEAYVGFFSKQGLFLQEKKGGVILIYHIQCVPQKRKPISQVHFSENCNELSEKVYIVTKFSFFPLSSDTNYMMYWSCMAEHEPFKILMSELICAE